jgi:hypothetical protein
VSYQSPAAPRLVAALLLAAPACRFGYGPGSPAGGGGGDSGVINGPGPDGGSSLPCSAGERAILPGPWFGTALGSAGLAVTYQAGEEAHLQLLDLAGTALGIPRNLGPSWSGGLHTGDSGRILLTLNTSVYNGWNQVLTSSISRPDALDGDPELRTATGWHSWGAVAIQRGDRFFLAHSMEVPSNGPSYHLRFALYDLTWTELGDTLEDPGLGEPRTIAVSETGYLLQTSTGRILPVDTGGALVSAGLPGSDYDQVALVRATPAAAPMLLRATGGAMELVTLDASAQITATRTVVTGRGPIAQLSVHHAGGDVLAAWQEDSTAVLLRLNAASNAYPPIEQPLAVNSSVRAVVPGSAGPLLLVERDNTSGDPETVVLQLCEP